jgi:toxin CcdB
MARRDVHRCRRSGVPYLVDNQADFLSRLPTRLVIPLVPAAAIAPPIDRLHLRVTVEGRELILATNLMASIRRDQLGEKVASLEDRRSEIVAAVAFLQQGF